MDMKIDFVVPWVDGSDPEWIKEYNKYSPIAKNSDTRSCNYRDFDLLRYWFRGVEKFGPWVNKVYFITNGQKPEWLNLNCKKLIWIKHEDFIPKENLPLFNSQAIEIGINEIEDLSEYFVYFNDDFYLTDKISQDFFFKNNKPRDMLVFTPLVGGLKSFISYTQLTDCALLNECFNKRQFVRKNFRKVFNLRYGKENLRNMLMLPFPYVSTFLNQHYAQPFLKSTLNKVWENFPEKCETTQESKFREPTNINQWLFRYWNLMEGNFVPTNLNKGRKYFTLGENFNQMCSDIKNQKYKEVVINDGGYDMSVEEEKKLLQSFNSILPEKSEFEI